MEWNVFVVEQLNSRRCYLAPLSHEVVFLLGLVPQAIAGETQETSETVMSDAAKGLDRDGFKPNPEFALFLHAVLAKHAVHCPGVLREAQRRVQGFVCVLDTRTPTLARTVPEEDIVGIVTIRDGKPIAYEGSPTYEPFGKNGLMRLDPWLEARYTEELLGLLHRRVRNR